jgi:hypothetical protein
MEEKFDLNISEDDSLKITSVLDAIQIFHDYYVKTKLGPQTEVAEKESSEIKH